jgi:hypothetical protein
MTLSRSLCGLTAIACIALGACNSDNGGTGPTFTCNATQRDTVDYRNLGTLQTDTFDVGGVTVTGSAAVNVLANNGLGIVGGFSNSLVDGVELIRFTFDGGPADSVSYFVRVAGGSQGNGILGAATIEAFNKAGASLGVDSVSSIGWKDVSEAFNHIPLSGFTVTARVDYFGIDRLTYASCN